MKCESRFPTASQVFRCFGAGLPAVGCQEGNKKGFGMWGGVYWVCVALKRSLVINAIGLPKEQSWQFASATVLLVTFWLKLRPVISFICKVVERVKDQQRLTGDKMFIKELLIKNKSTIFNSYRDRICLTSWSVFKTSSFEKKKNSSEKS